MTTLTAQAEITPDHRLTMNVPVPAELPVGWIEVTVALARSTSQPAGSNRDAVKFLDEIAARGAVSVPDPIAWQREAREDRSLPGRD